MTKLFAFVRDVATHPTKYRKAIAGFLAPIVTGIGALLSLGILSGPVSHDLAVAFAILTPIAGFFGVAAAPRNDADPEPPAA